MHKRKEKTKKKRKEEMPFQDIVRGNKKIV